jgi:exosortase/archaeosortase
MRIAGNARTGAGTTQLLLLLVTVAVAVLNGLEWSPFYDSVAYLLYLATRGYPLVTPVRLANVTPAAIAILTLLIAGIPAALYERILRLQASTPVSMGIWLVMTIILSIPTIRNFFGSE